MPSSNLLLRNLTDSCVAKVRLDIKGIGFFTFLPGAVVLFYSLEPILKNVINGRFLPDGSCGCFYVNSISELGEQPTSNITGLVDTDVRVSAYGVL